MSLINFLPQSYQQQAKRRRRRHRTIVLNAIVALYLVIWGFGERSENARLAKLDESLKTQETIARNQMTEIVKLQLDHKDLKHRFKIQNELHQPISHTQILATLSEVIPHSVALTDLGVVTKRPPPQSLKEKTKTQARSRKKEQVKPERVDDQVEIDLEAIAPDDLIVAQLIGNLSDHPLFDQVTMQYSRPIEIRGVEARQFRLSMRVRLDRHFTVMEVAHAD